MNSRHLFATEAAIEKIGGLLAILSYVHSVASAEDRQQLRDAEGWLLDALDDAVRAGRRGYEALYQRSFCAANANGSVEP